MEAPPRSDNYKLQVDVNGDEVFIVDKSIMESFSPKLSRLFSTSTTGRRNPNQLKVIFDDFPGGAEGFELVTRFCYSYSSKAEFPITPSNFVLLHCAAQFLEICIDGSERYVEGIGYWSWSDLVSALKQCQQLDSVSGSRFSSFVLRKVMGSVVARISPPAAASPSSSPTTSSSGCSASSISSSTSFRSYCSSRNWWFRALVFLKPDLLVELVRLMVREKSSDHSVIFKFVVFHLKSNVRSSVVLSSSSSSIVTDFVDTAVISFSLLDRNALSCKGLFDVLRIVVSCSETRILRSCRQRVKTLETLIGSRLDGASLDQLLVPYRERDNKTKTKTKTKKCRYMYYDVNFVMRLVKAFLIDDGRWISPTRLRKVVRLIDAYIREVAPDFAVEASEFEALVTILPDSERECSDGLYQAIDMYLETHVGVCGEEEKLRICRALNRGKLSAEASRHLAGNPRFPSMAAINAFVAQQSKLSRTSNVTSSSYYYYYNRSKSAIFGGRTETKKAEEIMAQKYCSSSFARGTSLKCCMAQSLA